MLYFLVKFSRLLLLVLACMLWIAPVQADMVIMHVFVNEDDKGEQFFQMMDDGEILFPAGMLEKMGLTSLPAGEKKNIDGEEYVALSSLKQALDYQMNEADVSLHIKAKADLFATHSIDFSQSREKLPPLSSDASAFVNYALSESRNQQFQSTFTGLNFEAGASLNQMLGFSSFSINRTPGKLNQLMRLLSNITWDDPERLQRIIVGDFSATSGELGSGGSFAGLSVVRNFSLDPNLIIYPGVNIGGILETPSDVDIFVNDRLVNTKHLPPGPFDLRNIEANSGSGDVRLVIRDAFGRQQEMTVPFYQVTTLLKPGMHDYSYNIGLKRLGLGTRNFSYAEPTALGFHRYGLSQWLTIGARGEADQRTINAGPLLSVAIGTWGQMSAEGAWSRRGARQGVATSLNYSYSGTLLSFGASIRSFSKDYVTIASPFSIQSQRLTASGSLGANLPFIGSLSAAFVYSDAYNNRSSKRYILSYNHPLFDSASLQIRATATKTDKWSKSFFATINFNFGDTVSGSIQHQWQDGQSEQSLDLFQNTPRGVGYGGRAHLARVSRPGGKTDYNGDVFGQYNADYGEYNATLRNTAGESSYSLAASGSLVWIDRGLYAGRPINDAFALVDMGGLKDVTVLSSNTAVGKTDSEGKLLVTDLLSNFSNRIAINPQDVAVNYDIGDSIDREVVPSYRGGAVLRFKVRKLQAFVGNFLYREEGAEKPAKYWGLELLMDGKPEQFILGDDGGFYLENIASGDYEARIFNKRHDCHFIMQIPESDEMMVDMGDIRCETH